MLKEIFLLKHVFELKDILLYILLFTMMVIGSLLEIAGVGIIPAFIATISSPDLVFQNEYAAIVISYIGIEDSKQLMFWGCIILLAVMLVKNLYMIFLYYVQIRLTEYHRVRLSTKMLSAYMYAPYEFLINRNSAELYRNVHTETTEIFNGVINPLLNLTLGFLLTLGIAVLLFVSTPEVALFSIALVGIGSSLFLKIVKGRLRRYGIAAREERTITIKSINQGLSATVDARVLIREGFFIGTFRKSYAKLARLNRIKLFINKTTTPFLEIISVVGLVGIVLSQINAESSSIIPILALFAAAIARLRNSITQVVNGVSQIQYSMAAITKVIADYKILRPRGSKKKKTAPAVQEEDRFSESLSIKNISYSYPDQDEPVLNNISLTINPGDSVAFVGSTGSGKTTLINILLGLLVPQEGKVEVDGKNLFDNLDWWRRQIGYIPQHIFLTDDTVRANIALGIDNSKIDDEKLSSAVKAAQLEEYIESLDEGLNTMVGERGVKISGGQRQRIGLARALYHNPSILLMDEATSALDNKTESLLMDALEELHGERTLIMIAHRLSTVKSCDKLFFLKQGVVSARGTFDEVANASEDFREMASLS